MTQEVKSSFWKRQFSEEITPAQNWFDAIFGIIVPILCLMFDPIVFRDDPFGRSGYLHSLQIFAYLSIGLGIMLLTIWLSFRLTSKPLIGAISGIFFAGAILASALGIVMLPISLLGLLIVIGILGFLPFLTAFVFLRNGIRSLRKLQFNMNTGLLIGVMSLGILIVVGIPLAINWKASAFVLQSVQVIIHSKREDEINLAVNHLKSVFWCSNSCYDEIVWSYEKEENEVRKQILAKAYLELTGEDIEQRLWMLND